MDGREVRIVASPEWMPMAADGVEARIRTSLENLVFAIGEAAGAERSSLFVVDDRHAELSLAIARSEEGQRLAVRMPLGTGVAGRAFVRGEAIRVDDAYACPFFFPGVDALSGFRTRSLLAVPVRRPGGGIAAVVELLNAVDRHGFSEDDEREVLSLEPELSALVEACGVFS